MGLSARPDSSSLPRRFGKQRRRAFHPFVPECAIGSHSYCEKELQKSNNSGFFCPNGRHVVCVKKDLFSEGSLREQTLPNLWNHPDAFAFDRNFNLDQLGGFCAVCRHRDICRGGCAWTAYSHTQNRFDNPDCFYRQALLHERLDLLADEKPTEQELAAIEQLGKERRIERG